MSLLPAFVLSTKLRNCFGAVRCCLTCGTFSLYLYTVRKFPRWRLVLHPPHIFWKLCVFWLVVGEYHHQSSFIYMSAPQMDTVKVKAQIFLGFVAGWRTRKQWAFDRLVLLYSEGKAQAKPTQLFVSRQQCFELCSKAGCWHKCQNRCPWHEGNTCSHTEHSS